MAEAYKASRMLRIHALMPILSMVVIGILQIVFMTPLYNPLALSQVSPAKRIEFIASSIADFVAYTGIAAAVFSLFTWLFMGLAAIHILRLTISKFEYLGLMIVIVASVSSLLLGYNSIMIRDIVYTSSLKALSKPEIASLIANMGVHLNEKELEMYVKAVAEALSGIRNTSTGFTIGLVALTLSIIPPILAILSLEPIARMLESKWPRILQLLLILMSLHLVLPLLPLPNVSLISTILGLVNILEPIAAWLTATRIKGFVEKKLLEV